MTLSLLAKAMSFWTLSMAVGILSLTMESVVSILESKSLAPETTSPLMVDALLWNPVAVEAVADFRSKEDPVSISFNLGLDSRDVSEISMKFASMMQ